MYYVFLSRYYPQIYVFLAIHPPCKCSIFQLCQVASLRCFSAPHSHHCPPPSPLLYVQVTSWKESSQTTPHLPPPLGLSDLGRPEASHAPGSGAGITGASGLPSPEPPWPPSEDIVIKCSLSVRKIYSGLIIVLVPESKWCSTYLGFVPFKGQLGASFCLCFWVDDVAVKGMSNMFSMRMLMVE